MTLFFILLTTLAHGFSQLSPEVPQSPRGEFLNHITQHNLTLALSEQNTFVREAPSKVTTPFFEWDETGYLMFSDETPYGSTRIKNILAKNLPPEVTLIVHTQSSSASYQNQLLEKYTALVPSKKVQVLQVPRQGQTGFWTRDNTPIPVWSESEFSVVDARYYYNFEPDQEIKNLLESTLISHQYFFEGGNLVNNSRGECIVVNRRRRYPFGTSDTAAIPDSVFENMYGCRKLIRLKHLKGIGHSDEVVKFLSDDLILTDTHEYVDILKEAGYTVVEVPEPRTRYGTYINSLIVNQTVFVPVYEEATDQKALDLYKKFLPSYKIIPVESSRLSSQGQGGVHCITMNYPKKLNEGGFTRELNL